MATEPKFRPSLTAAELALIQKLCLIMDKYGSPSPEVALSIPEAITLQKLHKSIQLFNFKINNEHTQASYIPTGTAKPRVSGIEDFLSESEIAEHMGLTGGIDYSSTTAMHTAYKNCQLAKSIGGHGTVEDTLASKKWIEYCDSHHLDYETGMERS